MHYLNTKYYMDIRSEIFVNSASAKSKLFNCNAGVLQGENPFYIFVFNLHCNITRL